MEFRRQAGNSRRYFGFSPADMSAMIACMFRVFMSLALTLHSSAICMAACAERNTAAREKAKPSCCRKAEAEKASESSCCCSPTAKSRPKPKGENCKCCISPDGPLGLPPAALRVAAPAASALFSMYADLSAGWGSIACDGRSTEHWLTRQGAATSHSVLCVWNN